MEFILSHLDSLDGHRYESRTPPTPIFSRTYASDASGIGSGTIEFSSSGFSLCIQRAFTEPEKLLSSTEQELMAFQDFYCQNLSELRGLSIVHYTDNFNLERLFLIGSRRSPTPSRRLGAVHD